MGRVEGRENLPTVNSALGEDELPVSGIWVRPPEGAAPPEECPPRLLPPMFRNTILDRIEVRVAQGRSFEEMHGEPGSPVSALWSRVPGHFDPSAATLAIFGDYVAGGLSQPLGLATMGRSLDNTIRIVTLEPTDWVLTEIHMHALSGGFAQGTAYMWSQSGTLLATASQSIAARLRDPSTL